MHHLLHWHIITDCMVMGSYTTKEQAESAVYDYMRSAALSLLGRWTQHLLDNGVITFSLTEDEVESWLIEPCSQPLDDCDPLEAPGLAGGSGRFGYLRRAGETIPDEGRFFHRRSDTVEEGGASG